jgi:hypothetical protein
MKIKINLKELKGANMDIDLCTDKKDIVWDQDTCPWNKKDNSNKHKCAVKNTSICPYFRGIKYIDTVLCSYPNKIKDE